MKNLRSIGNVYDFQGKYVEAIEKYEEALGIYRAIHGNEHEDVAMVLGNLRSVYLVTRRFDEVISSTSLILMLTPNNPNK
jgi:tetratricopeptide (TPR) repeat protein